MEQNIQAAEAARQRLEETTPIRKQYLAVCEQIAQLPPFAVADEHQRRYAYEPQVRGIEQLSKLGREYKKGLERANGRAANTLQELAEQRIALEACLKQAGNVLNNLMDKDLECEIVDSVGD